MTRSGSVRDCGRVEHTGQVDGGAVEQRGAVRHTRVLGHAASTAVQMFAVHCAGVVVTGGGGGGGGV